MSSYKNTELTDSIIYFTYGSNMNNQTQKWRQINYSRKFNAILENYLKQVIRFFSSNTITVKNLYK